MLGGHLIRLCLFSKNQSVSLLTESCDVRLRASAKATFTIGVG